jgi:hypothetical protein
MQTKCRDYALLEDIASYFETLARDSEAFALRGLGSKKTNLIRAKVWREAAEDVRNIELT